MEFDNRIDAGAGHKPEADLVEGSMAGDAVVVQCLRSLLSMHKGLGSVCK